MYVTLVLATLHALQVSADDAKYLQFKNKVLAGPSKLVKVVNVPNLPSCALECNMDPNCGHLTIRDDNPSLCEIYNSIDRTAIADVSGKTTYLRENPPGTMSAAFLMPLNMSNPSESGTVLWSNTAGDAAHNLDIDGVFTVQRCYELCLSNNNGVCWIFNYVKVNSRCIIPDYSGLRFTFTNRTALVRQIVPGAEYYMYSPTMLALAINENIDSLPHTAVPGYVFFMSNSWNDMNNNFQLPGVKSFQDCHKICKLNNDNFCRLFSYNSVLGICLVPYDNGTTSGIREWKQIEVANYTSYLVGIHTLNIADFFVASSWSSVTDLVLLDGMSSSQLNIWLTAVANETMCYRLCTKIFGTCQTFSYQSSTGTCCIADVNFHDEWTYVEQRTGFKGYFLKNTSKGKLITKHLEFQGVNPTTAYNTAGGSQTMLAPGDFVETASYLTNKYLKNSLIDYWNNLNSKFKIRIELKAANGTLLAWIEYFATGTSTVNWFAASTFANSSWTDLSSTAQNNIWAMGNGGRSWFISRLYAGCCCDAGWMVVQHQANYGCASWDSTTVLPMFLYSPLTTSTVWANIRAHYDVLIVKLIFN